MYVHDAKGWVKDRSYVEPVIAEVSHGSIRINGLDIQAKRGPQSAIFVYVETTKWCDKKNEDGSYPHEIRRMAGIGCYGYDDPIPRMCASVGIKQEEYDDIMQGSRWDGKKSTELLFCTKDSKTQEFEVAKDLGSKFVGVTPETYKEFITFLDEIGKERGEYDKEFHAWLEKVKKSEPLRANQGDMYFANHMPEIAENGVGTPVGKADEPVLTKISKQG